MKQPHHILAVRIAHPVWTLFLLALTLAVDHTGIVRLGLLCSCLHECGHLLVWVLLTRLPPTLIICPTGFCLSLRGVVLTPKQFIILAAAGPAVNLVLAAGGIAWLLGHPASYRLCYFIAANLLLGVFNLLPIHGLDGWQINSNLGILFHFKIQTQKHSCVN